MILSTRVPTKKKSYIMGKETASMKVKVNVGEKNYAMPCRNGQLRPGKGKTVK